MVFFITFLRAIAACLITNSHYTNIYPIEAIASGGLIGDVLFFAVSGYCLYNVKNNFFTWYGKRVWRIYLPVAIITAFYFLINSYKFTEQMPTVFHWFIYPTYYHFIASIILLYIPFYFVCKLDVLKKNIPWIMLGIFTLATAYYIFFYDKTYYHIDVVEEWFIRILFFESMLLGAWFREKDNELRNNLKHFWVCPLGVVISFCLYFTTKLFFSNYQQFAYLQIINWVTIFALLFFIFKTFSAIDKYLEKLPKWIKSIIMKVAELTLEIYLVQHVIIGFLDSKTSFPINWIIVTVAIIAGAFLLNFVCKLVYKLVDSGINVLRKK